MQSNFKPTEGSLKNRDQHYMNIKNYGSFKLAIFDDYLISFGHENCKNQIPSTRY
jgi:hypothetical protein